MKIVVAVGVIALLAGAYLLGRRDAPNDQDAQVKSLIAGVTAYAQRYNDLTRRLNAAQAEITAGLGREAVLAKKRTPTPVIVPANCAPWAENLSTCDQQVASLKSGLEATGRLLSMAKAGRAQDSARTDSLSRALKRERGKDRVFGVKLPSRSTSFLYGAVGGTLACLLLCPGR